MGNLGGGEVLVILLVALIVLGPTKLPAAIRQVGRFVGEVRRIGAGFQQELREAAEPLTEPLRETTATLKAADRELREVTKSFKDTAAKPGTADPRGPRVSSPPSEDTAAKPGAADPAEKAVTGAAAAGVEDGSAVSDAGSDSSDGSMEGDTRTAGSAGADAGTSGAC